MLSTRDRIWQAALELFAQQSYESVTVKAIAAAVQIKDASLYNHFKSKQEIYKTIIQEMRQRIAEASHNYAYPVRSDSWEFYRNQSGEELTQISNRLFHFYTQDPMIANFRKMLLIEKYAQPNSPSLFQTIFIDEVLAYQESIFRHFVNEGLFIEAKPEILALHFYSPLFLLMMRYDTETLVEVDIEQILADHVKQFVVNYAKEV